MHATLLAPQAQPADRAVAAALSFVPVKRGPACIASASSTIWPLICWVFPVLLQPEYYQRYRICKMHLKSPALLVRCWLERWAWWWTVAPQPIFIWL